MVMLTSAMPVAANLGDANVNDTHGYITVATGQNMSVATMI
jgi:hypothetical protein